MRQLDDAMREAESVRAHLDRARTRQPFWPDRRSPKRWERASDGTPESPRQQEQVSGTAEPEFADE